MTISENIKSGISFAADTVSEIASSIAEKNRLRAQLTAIKKVIKNDTATRDQAYIELGRFFYDNLREGASAENEALCAVIDTANDRISKASLKYIEVLNIQNETKIRSENAEKLAKAIAERTKATAQTAKEKGAVLADSAKEFAAEKAAVAKEFAAEKAAVVMDFAKEKAGVRDDYADIVKENAEAAVEAVEEQAAEESSAEIEELVREEQEKLKAAEAAEEKEAVKEAPAAEESPESFDF